MVQIIAHRGASAAAPENTVEAFTLARQLGADWVELDARRTADGHIVVHHDAHLPDGRAVVDTNRADLPDQVCSLADALDACAGMGVNIEIKNWPADVDFDPEESVAAAVATLVGERSQQAEVLVSCFHEPTLARVRDLDSSIATAWLYLADDRPADELAAAMAVAGHSALHPWDGSADQGLVDAAHAHGLAVNVWTVDDPDRMAALVALGVDGLCTNVPDVARRVLDEGAGQDQPR
ncbi:MAG: glycerophosphodiester phosphodiesterase [Acidimicrobiales bacterium]